MHALLCQGKPEDQGEGISFEEANYSHLEIEDGEEFVEAEKVIDTPGQFSLLTPPLKNDIHAK